MPWNKIDRRRGNATLLIAAAGLAISILAGLISWIATVATLGERINSVRDMQEHQYNEMIHNLDALHREIRAMREVQLSGVPRGTSPKR